VASADQPGRNLTYSVVTPARNEADTLPNLAAALRRQSHGPLGWVIVEGGSTDATASVAEQIASDLPWTELLILPDVGSSGRGAPIVRALHAGFASIATAPDVVVNVDADVTMEPDYFERLLDRFLEDPSLGIASGSAWEPINGISRQRFVTGGTVWGAMRAYRWQCLQDVLPLEERHGWDGADELKARARGWTTRTFTDLPFRHHRPEGTRDGTRWAHWRANGDTSYFLGYRPWYLLARMAHRVRREPAALGLAFGYAAAAARRAPRLDDANARAVLRSDQSLGNILARRREALGLASGTGSPRLRVSPTGRSRVRIGHLDVDSVTFDEALARIDELVARREGGAVFTPNVDHVVKAERNATFRAAYGRASLAVADGMPLLWASRLLGSPLPEKVSGSDLVVPLARLAGERRWRVYLLGGAPEVVGQAGEVFVRRFGVRVVGTDSPAVGDDGGTEDADGVIARVRAARPDLLLVALGAPKQELWIDRFANEIRPGVAIGIGGSLDFVVGRVRRAPGWMSRIGLEWLFRLVKEPRRMWRRYLLEDPAFLAIVARTWRTRAGAGTGGRPTATGSISPTDQGSST
jgi:N-acetylglucosaminyldiphosphoundecaprenol N-acetyl-beta-D-mannosaminyltransferase